MVASIPRPASKIPALAALAAAVALTLGACAGADPDSVDPPDAGGAAELEIGEVKLAVIKSPGAIPLVEAEQVTAAEYGLQIEPVFIDNSGVAITSVISGEVAAANASFFGAIDAINQGLDLVLIAEGWASTPGTGTLEALPASGITSLADLPGRTVNVISLNSSHAVKLRDVMLQEGLDPDAVNWVELPYGEVAAALEQGTIDASSAVGATLGTVKGMGSVTVFDYGGEPYIGMAESGWWSSRQFVEQNPGTVAAMQCALFAAQDTMVTDRDRYDALFVEVLGAPLEVAQADVMVEFQTTNRLDQIQRNAEIYEAAGRISEPFDFTPYVLGAPATC